MIHTGFESRVKVQQILRNQLPEFVVNESPKTLDFLKQYYISQEYQGGPIDISDNLDQYLKVDNLTPDVVVGFTTLTTGIGTAETTISVSNTKGFPVEYGLLKINDEIITYTGKTATTFTGCVRGFSGITSYHKELNQEELVFSTSEIATHNEDAYIENLSSLFLKEFYRKLKYTLTPGLEDVPLISNLNAGTFIKEARSLYESKGTDESFRILFNALYGETPKVVNLEEFLIKPSSANYVRREVVIAEAISGNPLDLVGQTIYKLDDTDTNASISEVEAFSRAGVALTTNQQYFKISLFIGYSDEDTTIQGNFKITPATRSLETVSIGSSVISVDSTVGFANTGVLISGINTNINYTSKSVNQFFGCTGIDASITETDTVRNSEIYYSYENGDTSKKVELRLTGVLSGFDQISKTLDLDEGQIISVKNVGDLITGNYYDELTYPYENMTHKQIFANSLIYNTCVRYNIKSIVSTTLVLEGKIDRSSLKKGDLIEIVVRSSNNVVHGDATDVFVTRVDNNKTVVISSSFTVTTGLQYDIRRKVHTAKSNNVPLEVSNIISDVQNLYIEDDKTAYLASNSLPAGATPDGSSSTGFTTSFVNTIKVSTKSISVDYPPSIVGNGLTYEVESNTFGAIKFNANIPFMNGDEVYYEPSGIPYVGLETGSYFVGLLTTSGTSDTIQLYDSKSFINKGSYIKLKNSQVVGVGTTFVTQYATGNHKFTLNSQKSNQIGAQKSLKKFPFELTTNRANQTKTTSGSIGMLINGVEITNYKTEDYIYYGPLKSVNILNGGEDYDILNLPKIEISAGVGTTALVQPVGRGSIKNVYVDPQGFNIDKFISIETTGGNSTAVLEPIIVEKSRVVKFDSRFTDIAPAAGGINTSTDTIKFTEDHGFYTAQEVIYNADGSSEVGVGIGTSTLVTNSSYFTKIIDNETIQLFNTSSDALAGINTIVFGSSRTSGIQEIYTLPNQKTVEGVRVIDGGDFENRQLLVKPSGISTIYNTVTFENHGFGDGDLIEYNVTAGVGTTTPQSISGLTTTTGITSTSQYYNIVKINDDSFKLSDAGIGVGASDTNFNRNFTIDFSSQGTGYQIFKYPDVKVTLTYTPVGFGTTSQSYTDIILTPEINGSIVDTYLYESGTGYGSTILNFEKKPVLSIKTGKLASLKPIIVNGLVESVNIQYGGEEYFSTPTLNVLDSTGSGTGAQLRPVIANGKITDVKVISTGIGYSSTSSINVVSAGKNAVLGVNIRPLTIELNNRLGNELLLESSNKLGYSVCGYGQSLSQSFGEVGSGSTVASKIIGWAYDGNPIYGPYGYQDPANSSDDARRLVSGYESNITNIVDRPLGFDVGFFIEDYKFTNSGDLDRNNGRFGKTPEFPNGVYAYFSTIDTNGDPQFPYFIGDSYRSIPLEQNIDQSFDFKASDLRRNTFPYRVSDKNADNDFIIETNELESQKIEIESITQGSIDELSVVSAGSSYKINDSIKFEDIGSGSGVITKVSSLKGKPVTNVSVATSSYDDAVFVWDGNDKVKVNVLSNHNWINKNNIIISGVSTSSGISSDVSALSAIDGEYVIGVTSTYSSVISEIPVLAGSASTEIYVSTVPNSVSVGSSLVIGGEHSDTCQILNIFKDQNILRVVRSNPGVAHSVSSPITFVTNSFSIDKSVPAFDSKLNDSVYFNPAKSVGFGTTSGVTHSTTFGFGSTTITRNIPTQRIYIENHPFKTNQQITFTKASGAAEIDISTTPVSALYNLPSTLYVSDTTPNTIGIKTGVGAASSDVYFRACTGDDDTYLFKSNFNQVTGNLQKIEGTVSISTSSTLGLKFGDVVDLNIQPNLSVGIGTSTAIKVVRDSETGFILVNPVETIYSNIDVAADTIRIDNHGFKRGDKIFYTIADGTFPTGLTTNSSYFTYVVDENFIQLSETSVDCLSNPPKVVDITAAGLGTSKFYSINPQIEVVKNNNLVFDLSDSSLQDYQLKFYYDNEFKNDFVSTASTTNAFNIIDVGTVGVGTTSSRTINYNTSLPTKLYYSLEKSGFISTADTDVVNYSEIKYVDSLYNKSYNVVSVASTTFGITLSQVPEKLSYNSSECDDISYTTSSLNEKGPISNVNIISGGINYKKIPNFVGSSSTEGSGAYVIAKSKSIGNVNKIRILNEGFEYSADNTLEPTALISPLISVNNSSTIGIVTVTDGGLDYLYAPNIVVVDSTTSEKIDRGLLQAELSGNSISKVDVIVPPNGLPDGGVSLFAVNNSNGVSISTVASNSTGIFTCYTGLGTGTDAGFAINDEVFVEGIARYIDETSGIGTEGTGFNSEDYGYKFGTVTGVTAGTNWEITINLESTGISTNAGIAKTDQESFATLINKNNYPTFTTVEVPNKFVIGEELIIDEVLVGLTIQSFDNDFIKVYGTYDIKVGDVILGSVSGSRATIDSIKDNLAKYKVKFSNKKDIGWSDDIGKLDLDNQVIPDNDYYQNLSYTIKSSKGYEELRSPVSALLHTSGLKNFADVGIGSTTRSTGGISTEGDWRVGTSSTDFSIVIKDVYEDSRVETITDVDTATDYTESFSKSKFIKLDSLTLLDYTEAKSNEVLLVDNINSQFSNLGGDPSEYLDVQLLDDTVGSQTILFRTTNLSNTSIQTNELVILNNGSDKILLEKSILEDDSSIGTFSIDTNTFGTSYLRFTPEPNAYDYDYNLKSVKTSIDSSSGVGTYGIGFINKVSFVGIATTSSSGVTTTSIVSADANHFTSFLTQNHLVNKNTNEMNYVEVYVIHDGTDTYISEYFVDTHSPQDGYSGTLMGSFNGNISGSTFSLEYKNDLTDEVEIKSNIVGFGTTAVGIGTYRFKATAQPDGSERTAIYQSDYFTGVGGTTNLVGLSSGLFNSGKSLVQVSVGSTRIVSEVMFNHDSTNTFFHRGAFLSPTGLGTHNPVGVLTAGYDGSEFVLKFTPEAAYASNTIEISALTLGLYTDTLLDNHANINDFEYGQTNETIGLQYYNSINGDRINRTNFTLNNDNTPIFAKSFNPNDSNIVNLSTGLITIKNHFFRTNEELIYTPNSTFVGVGSTPMQYVSGAYHHQLPSTVFAIRNDFESFYISTERGGSAVTFAGVGTGNAHELSMALSNTKGIFTIDNVIQAPLAYSPVNHTLQNNAESVLGGVGIGTTATIFSVSGISSLAPQDILKVDNEYMKVLNLGIGTETFGPITTGIGTTTLVEVERGFVGTSATAHTNTTTVQLYKGSYNIVGKEIHFTSPPKGNPQLNKTVGNLNWPTSDFTGRVYLRNDYTTNQVYDDVSDKFTGITTNFNLTVNGSPAVGMGTTGGNGLTIINGIFQRPSAENNPQNNYEILDPTTGAATTSIMFTGITTEVGDPIVINEVDINENQLPRGGVIISLGSTPGLGYAPLVPAQVYASLNVTGGISTIIGAATTGPSNSITTASYNNETGYLEITTENAHNFEVGIVDQVKLAGLEFTCSGTFNVYDADYNQTTGDLVLTVGDHYLAAGQFIGIKTDSLTFTCSQDSYGTNHSYPRHGTDPIAGIATPINSTTNSTITVNVGVGTTSTHQFVGVGTEAIIVRSGYSGTTSNIFPYAAVGLGSTSFDYTIVSVGATNKFTTEVGINSIPHTFVGGGSVMPWYGGANFGSAYRGDSVSIAVTDIPFTHKFVSAATNTISGISEAPSYVDYNPATGYMVISLPNHGKTTSDTVTFNNDTITLTCSKDDYATEHTYPRASDRISGIATPVTAYDDNTFTVYVGENAGSGAVVTATVGAGGTLAFGIDSAGANYQNPQIVVPAPSYAGLGVTGISRLSTGSTTDTGVGLLLNLEVGAASTVGIGSTQFAINKWEIARNGYAFQRGDIFAPVGLVTDANLASPVEECQFEVLDVYSDPFAAWQFGQFDYIDSIKGLQNGTRRRFDLKYDGDLLSFEIPDNPDFPSMNLANALLILVNGILQEPKVAYDFEGGTSFVFTEAPKPEDDVAIFFYRGSPATDSSLVTNVTPSIKKGDTLQLMKIMEQNPESEAINQDPRLITDLSASDKVETNLYTGVGIGLSPKSLSWTKQKVDRVIDGEFISKSRGSLESLVFPSAKVIKNIGLTDNTIYLDSTELFDYDVVPATNPVGGIIIENVTPVSAALTATVSAAGTISGLTIVSGGSGYIGATTSVSISTPPVGVGTFIKPDGSVGLGSTATATVTVSNGVLTGTPTITMAGLGYTLTNPPQVIASRPNYNTEQFSNATVVKGFSGIVTGIGTAVGVGTILAVEFYLERESSNQWNELVVGNPVLITDTQVGSGVTSVYESGSGIVGIGTTFIDNVYHVAQISYPSASGNTGVITCNVEHFGNHTGIGSTGSTSIGRFSWGSLSGTLTRSNPVGFAVSGFTINAGLSTFPTLQRRSEGLRDTGGLEPQ